MPKAPKYPPVPPLSADDAVELSQRIDAVVLKYHGQFDELEAALGMLVIGRIVGWKVLALIHNKRTIRKYEEILGISIREAYPEEGPLAQKSRGYRLATKLGQYWKAVSGEVKLADRRELSA